MYGNQRDRTHLSRFVRKSVNRIVPHATRHRIATLLDSEHVTEVRPRIERIAQEYRISGCTNLAHASAYQNPEVYPDFRSHYWEFLSNLDSAIVAGQSHTYLHIGDGDYYVLTGQAIGSARPGKRAISKPIDARTRQRLLRNVEKATYRSALIYPNYRNLLSKRFPSLSLDYATEFIYASLSSRWLLKKYGPRIGLIGAGPKIRLIKDLMASEMYRSYLGTESFGSYVEIPQKFAADNPGELISSLRDQMGASNVDLYLLGMGSSKMAVLHELPRIQEAIYLDVGVGIDALAGIVNPWRPYFGSWVNHQFRDPSRYDDIDFLQVDEFLNRIFVCSSQ